MKFSVLGDVALTLAVVLAIARAGAIGSSMLWGEEERPVERTLIYLLGSGLALVLSCELLLALGLFELTWFMALAIVLTGLTWNRKIAFVMPSDIWGQVGLVLVFGILLFSVSGSLPSADFDTAKYHMVMALHFLHTHSLWALPYQEPGEHLSTSPGGLEAVAALLMLGAHSQALAFASSVCWAGIFFASGAVLCERAGGSYRAGVIVAVALWATPIAVLQMWHTLMNDYLVADGMLVPALLLFMVNKGDMTWRKAAMVGLALGLGASAKFSGLYACCAIPLIFVAEQRWRRRGTWIHTAGFTASIIAGELVSGGVWYLRNWVDTGNPLWPQQLSIQGITVLSGQVVSVTNPARPVLVWLVHDFFGRIGEWAGALVVFWPFLIFACVVGLLFPWDAARLKVALVGALGVGFYLVTPYSVHILPFEMRMGFAGWLAVACTLVAVSRWTMWLVGASAALQVALITDLVFSHKSFLAQDAVPALVTGAAILVVCASILLSSKMTGHRIWRGTLVLAALLEWSFCLAATFVVPQSPLIQAVDRRTGSGPILDVSFADATALLGPQGSNRVESVGVGKQGMQLPVNGTRLVAIAESMHPSLVVVGHDSTDVPAQTFRAPSCWIRELNSVLVTVYKIPHACYVPGKPAVATIAVHGQSPHL